MKATVMNQWHFVSLPFIRMSAVSQSPLSLKTNRLIWII